MYDIVIGAAEMEGLQRHPARLFPLPMGEKPVSEASDIWVSGDAYEPYVGRWSRVVAREFLAWLDVPTGSRWLDVGCGTGALTTVILEKAIPSEVLGVDPSAGFVAYARAHVTDSRARFEIGDARALAASEAAFAAVVAGLSLNFVPDPTAAVVEMARVVRPGGIVGAYVWDYAGGMELMRRFWDAVSALDPSARDLDEGRIFAAFCNPDALADLFSNAGLGNVETRAVDIPTVFRDFDDYWDPFLGGQGPAPAYLVTMNEERRNALRERLRTDMAVTDDGHIALVARAWAVRGERSTTGN
jgi:SAM-dependent methyltransferase